MAAGKFYKGKNLRIRIEGETLFHSTTCGLSVAKDMEDQSTKDTNGKIVIPGDYAGTLSMESLMADKEDGSTSVADWADLLQYELDGTELSWEFSTGEVGDKIVSGKMYVNNTDLTAPNGETASASFAFTTNGDILISTITE